ncbi:MAG: Rieske 2Fe-2S domain-containing protein [Alphaproteobacteria bacterium]|nr:Rieske 2Fe-2S domain-containing protein [Alphaproteobacteria bacterium]
MSPGPSARFPFPHDPVGWFCLGLADQVAPGALQTLDLFGRQTVLFRGQDGQLGLLDAYCPHMGAHFGHGGCVDGDHLRCPFHDFRFDRDGSCVSTPYDHAPPRGARARAWPLVERDGLLFAWHHPFGEPPSFDLPAHDISDWTRLRLHAWELDSHPQEISENSVDTGHFAAVHSYRELEVVEPLQVDGPVLRTTYAFSRSAREFGIRGDIRLTIRIQVLGLGVSIVDTTADRLPLRTRQFVLPTPTADGRVKLRIGIHMQRPERWRALSPALALLPGPVAELAVGHGTLKLYAHEVAQDLDVWKNKIYVHPPRLAKGDGPVGRYRAWCRQFYPHMEDAVAAR